MNITDKRNVEILATHTPRVKSRKNLRLCGLGLVILMVGGIIFMAGQVFGIGIMVVGVALTSYSTIKQERYFKRARQEYLDYFEKNNDTPPFPEDVK